MNSSTPETPSDDNNESIEKVAPITIEPANFKQALETVVSAQFYQMSLNLKNVLTIDECSDYTGLTKNYIYKLTNLKLIPHFKPNGKKLFFKRQDIDDWLLSNKVEIEMSPKFKTMI